MEPMDLLRRFGELLPLLIVPIVFSLMLAGWLWERRKARLRREALQEEARRMGFVFEEEDLFVMDQDRGRCPLFTHGNSKKYLNVLRGPAPGGGRLTFFDYHYVTGSGKSRQHHRQSVAAFLSETRRLPDFQLRPEGLGEKFLTLFGYQDIDFGENPVFSGKYLLRGKDEPGIRALFHPGLLRAFEAAPGWCVEGGGRWLVFYKPRTIVEPAGLKALLEELRPLVSAFPA